MLSDPSTQNVNGSVYRGEEKFTVFPFLKWKKKTIYREEKKEIKDSRSAKVVNGPSIHGQKGQSINQKQIR
jgi:hypothetical protein